MIIDQNDINLAESYRGLERIMKFHCIELQAVWNKYLPEDQQKPQQCFCDEGARRAFHSQFFQWLDKPKVIAYTGIEHPKN